jgi:hypothetical protein
MASHPKRPRDPNQLAKAIVDIATGQKSDSQPLVESDNNTASDWARRGGLKGGRARAAQLSEERRKEIAKAAAAARWKDKDR